MGENQTPSSLFSKKNVLIAVVILAMTAGFYFLQPGTFFKASILDISQAPVFDGTTLPVKYTLKWTALTSQQFQDFKSGVLTYDTAGSLLMPIPTYDSALYCDTDPITLGKTSSDLEKRNSFLTYVTVFDGRYTSGAGKACEGDGSHPAVDIRAPKGTPVYNIANGVVTKVKMDASNGNMVCVTHPNVPSVENAQTKTTYVSCHLHLDVIDSKVVEGKVILKGEQVGTMGTTGLATTYHDHFQLDKQEAPFHPYWPFTSYEAKSANLDFFSGVNSGLGQANVRQYTANSMKWVQQYISYSDSKPSNTVSPSSDDLKTSIIPVTENKNSADSVKDDVKNENSSATEPLPPITESNVNTNQSPAVDTIKETDKGFFKDVSSGNPNATAIVYLKKNNVVGGNPDGTFEPESKINRAALTKIIVEAKFPGQAKGNKCFSDVKDEWFAPYVCFAKERGIIGGYPDGKFQPNKDVSFAEAAKIISVGFNFTSGDSPTIPWYKLFVDTLAAKKAIPVSISSFDQQISRGEMAEIMYRLMASVVTEKSQTYVSLGGVQ